MNKHYPIQKLPVYQSALVRIALMKKSTSPEDVLVYAPQAAAAQQLLSPSEMGELFKVIAFGKDYAEPLMGFASGDRRRSL